MAYSARQLRGKITRNAQLATEAQAKADAAHTPGVRADWQAIADDRRELVTHWQAMLDELEPADA